MNRLLQEKWPWIEGTHAMRTQVVDILSDAELGFNPGARDGRDGVFLHPVTKNVQAGLVVLQHGGKPGDERGPPQGSVPDPG